MKERIWVGERYEEHRIFVLGESWYGTADEFPGDLITDAGWIAAYLRAEVKDALYARIANAVEKPREVFSQTVAFTNFVRSSVGRSREQKASGVHFKEAVPRLRRLLDELKPRGVFLTGTGQAEYSGPVIGDARIPWVATRHPTGSRGVSHAEVRAGWDGLMAKLAT